MGYYKEQIARWTKATKNWEWNSGVYIFIVFLFLCFLTFFQDYAVKAEIIWSYYHLSSEDKHYYAWADYVSETTPLSWL